MATSTITGLAAAAQANLTDTAVVPVDDSAVQTRKASVAQLRIAINTGTQSITGNVEATGDVVAAGSVTSGVGINGKSSTLGSSRTALSVAGDATLLLPNTQTAALLTGAFAGIVVVYSGLSATFGSCAFMVDTASGTPVAIMGVAGPGVNWGVVAGVASKINVYVTGGVLTVQNNSGSTMNYRVMALRVA